MSNKNFLWCNHTLSNAFGFQTEEHPLKSMLEIIVKERLSEGDKARAHHHSDSQPHPSEQTPSRATLDMTDNVKQDEHILEGLQYDIPRYLLTYCNVM